MKLTKYHPKNLFRSKKSKSSSISITDDPRFGSGSSLTSSSSSTNLKEGSSSGTPTGMLPINIEELWSVEELVEAFKLIDKYGDGKITRSEFFTLRQMFSHSQQPTQFFAVVHFASS
ncbi:hypothetical protein MKX03_008095 [Papaver bracteatum]|nr:hypothetical protein MKX03_008095 [Papaver bracteatum]